MEERDGKSNEARFEANLPGPSWRRADSFSQIYLRDFSSGSILYVTSDLVTGDSEILPLSLERAAAKIEISRQEQQPA